MDIPSPLCSGLPYKNTLARISSFLDSNHNPTEYIHSQAKLPGP